MPLTDKQIKNLLPEAKAKKYFDGNGLYLEVAPRGGKWWRLKYRLNGVEKRISIGVYPDVSLREARKKSEDARRLIRDGIDPSIQKRRETVNASRSFRLVGQEWFTKQASLWSETHQAATLSRMERLIYPKIGRIPVDALTPGDILALCRSLEIGVSAYMAHVILSIVSRIMRYSVASGYIASDPCRDIEGALTPHQHKHYPSITAPREIGKLAQAIDGYNGQFLTRCALQLLLLTMVRSGELRRALWTEFDWDEALWRIPAERMKMRREHLVPLSRQAIKILRTLQSVSGHEALLFPGRRVPSRPMSENTINAALRYMGYDSSEIVAHGFRSIASTRLNEMGYPPDVIEKQLAHIDGNQVRAVYNRAAYLDDRRRMMQEWADYLDKLKEQIHQP